MKKYALGWMGVLLLLFFASWQSQPVKENYDKLWTQVQQYSKKDLPRSALKVIDKIYARAKSDGNETQVLKSLIYRLSMESRFQEDFRLKGIRLLQNEVKSASPVEKSILYSMLGQLYQGYYRSHLGKIVTRETPALSDTALQTLDARQWQQKIAEAYLASVSNPGVTGHISLQDFSPILQNDKGAFTRWPTLYDLLAGRAIKYFSHASSTVRFPQPAFHPDTSLLAPVPVFLQERFSGDTLSSTARVLHLFQQVLLLHRQRGDSTAFLDANLRRLEFVSELLPATFANKLAYSHVLENLVRQYASQPVVVRIASQLAGVYLGMDNLMKGEANYKLKAEAVCRKALKKFPDVPFSANCKNLIKRINRPEFSFKTLQAVLPKKPFLSYVSVKDCPALWIKVVRVPAGAKKRMKSENTLSQMEKFVQQQPVVSWKQVFPFPADHRKHTAEVRFPAMMAGTYVIFVSDGRDFTTGQTVLYQQIQVTNLSLLSHADNAKKVQQVYLLYRDSGAPVAGATFHVYARYYDNRRGEQKQALLGSYTADAMGKVEIPFKNDDHYNGFWLEAVSRGDTMVAGTYSFLHGFLYEPIRYEKTYFFTDRAIYRPGQTVYFKAIQVSQKGDSVRLVPRKQLMISLMNAQYKKVDELKLETDSSGSVSGSFILPDEALNGRFLLKSATGSKGILMENYKRPTFFIAFDTLKKSYALNQTVRLDGRVAYYFGAKADSIPVRFTVERISYFPVPLRGWYPVFPRQVQVAGGKVFTDRNGHFAISFKAKTNAHIPAGTFPVYRFVVHVEVTDASGEMHAATQDIRLSKRSVLLQMEVPAQVPKEQTEGIEMRTVNLSGNDVPATVEVNLFRLTAPETYLLKRPWKSPDTVLMDKAAFKKEFPHWPWLSEADKSRWPKTGLATISLAVNGKTFVFPSRLSGLKPGYYLVTAKVKGQPGPPVKKYFTVFSERSKKLPVTTAFWHSFSQTTAKPGDVVVLQTGSARHRMPVLFELISNRRVVQQRWLIAGKKLTKVEIPVKEAYRGNFFVRLTGVADNRFYSWTQTIKVPFDNKKLMVGLATMRHNLKPGGKETWTVTVSNLSGTPQKAYVLAGMYDASLDVYAVNHWHFFPYRTKMGGNSWRSYLFGTGYNRMLFSRPEKMLPETVLNYPYINWFGYPVYGWDGVYSVANNSLPMMKAAANVVKSAPVALSRGEKKQPETEPAESLPPEQKNPPLPLRTDFRATAFFYPDLVTDPSGKVSFSFQLPDALTRWKFMVLAYTGDVKTGVFEQEFTARKALTILPHLPRFVRQGDRLLFTARLSNLSQKTLPVTVNLSFFDPQSGKKLNLFLQRMRVEKRVVLKPGQNGLVSWYIRIPDTLSFLGYRIRAVSGNHADGEERMVPVLSNRQLVTESLPLFVKGGQKKTFTFSHFLDQSSSSRQSFRYTLTFTSHPAWYAVQAMPYLGHPEYKSAENLFYSFYVRALAAKLIKTYPRIQRVFDEWKQKSPDAFLSALQKNSSLKDIVLQATPWLLEARNETEQKRRVALFFDLNQMQYRQQAALAKLQAAQLPSGAWPWFPDMPADFFTTQHILSGLFDLWQAKALAPARQPGIKQMIDKGIGYLDREMQAVYARLRKMYPKTLGKNHLTEQMVRYCYLRSGWLAQKPADDKTEQVLQYVEQQLRRYWPGLNNDLQALSALALNRMGRGYDAEAIIRALNEKSLRNAQGGMFWRNENPYGTQNAVSTEVDIMKAFAGVMHDNRSVESMKTWLIMQKQGNRWPGNKATADAVYALLMTGKPLLNETQPVEIRLGPSQKVSLHSLKLQPGSGYFSKIWMGKAITPDLATLTVDNPNPGMAYGAAYWQYFENLDKIGQQASAVSIQKTLYKEVVNSQGKHWIPLSENDQLKTGDMVRVRLLIRSQRAVDFVHVSDGHAAAFEPALLLSSYRYQGGLSFYEEIKDATTHFFVRHLPKGTFVLEYVLKVTQKGIFSDGIARIQSLYLPSVVAHSSGRKIKVQ